MPDDKSSLIRSVLFTLLIGAASVAGLRANTSEALRVRVLDGVGKPIYAASVTLRSRSGDLKPRHVLTGADGIADFGSLAPGDRYALEVTTLAGEESQRGLRVPAGVGSLVDVRIGPANRLRGPAPAGTALAPSTTRPPPLRGAEGSSMLMPTSGPTTPPASDPRGLAFTATLGARFGSSVLDGSGAHRGGNLEDRSFETVHPWLQLAGTLTSGRAWYRLSQDVLKDERPIRVGSQTLIQTTRQSAIAPRVAWQISPRNRLALEYQGRSLETDNLGISSTLGAASSLSVDTELDSLGLTWVAPVSTQLEVRSGVTWWEVSDRVFPSRRGQNNDCVRGLPPAEFLGKPTAGISPVNAAADLTTSTWRPGPKV